MNWVSGIGYSMFPLDDAGKEIASFQEVMHIVVTVLVVLLSVASLTVLIVAGYRQAEVRGLGIWAAVALALMMIGAIGTGIDDGIKRILQDLSFFCFKLCYMEDSF